mmetsp:Transcript_52596/g.102872  ORF Transcript_52596/g.102872 Transcript_52596/m.102872 type:complete len:224 (-) Transcript_52596:22-693(-)
MSMISSGSRTLPIVVNPTMSEKKIVTSSLCKGSILRPSRSASAMPGGKIWSKSWEVVLLFVRPGCSSFWRCSRYLSICSSSRVLTAFSNSSSEGGSSVLVVHSWRRLTKSEGRVSFPSFWLFSFCSSSPLITKSMSSRRCQARSWPVTTPRIRHASASMSVSSLAGVSGLILTAVLPLWPSLSFLIKSRAEGHGRKSESLAVMWSSNRTFEATSRLWKIGGSW